MKKTLSLLTVAAIAQFASYGITFTPSDADLDDLDHHFAYSWGINWTLPAGHHIISAQIKFTQIFDWRVEPDSLFIHLLDRAQTGVDSWQENSGDNVTADYFTGSSVNLSANPGPNQGLGSVSHIHIATWEDIDGQDSSGTHATDVTIPFTPSQIATLTTYIQNDGRFALGFDPDCHYFNNKVTFKIVTAVPDNGTTLVLFSLGLSCLVVLRRHCQV